MKEAVLKQFHKLWQKAAVLGIAVYGSSYVAQQYRTLQDRSILQTKAAAIGNQPQPALAPVRKLIVILETGLSNRGAKALYESEVFPIFNLAGMAVEVIETRERGQAKDTARQMNLKGAEGIVVVGTDGAFQDFVTGWMRRDDHDMIGSKIPIGSMIPIGIIPAGDCDTINRALRGDSSNVVYRLGEAALAIANGTTKLIDLMEVTNESGQKVNAIGYLSWGLPAALAATTFNPYSVLSRGRAKYELLKDAFFHRSTPLYKVEMVVGDSTTSQIVEFTSLSVSSTANCRGIEIAPGRTIDDGHMTVSIVPGPFSAYQLFKKWRALRTGSSLQDAFELPRENTFTVDKLTVKPIALINRKSVIRKPQPTMEGSEQMDDIKELDDVPLNVDGEVFESFPVHIQ
eukprot:Ihof_evm7s201 gene=Ihof_evmTU7s201